MIIVFCRVILDSLLVELHQALHTSHGFAFVESNLVHFDSVQDFVNFSVLDFRGGHFGFLDNVRLTVRGFNFKLSGRA
jgi:hypothetical protein